MSIFLWILGLHSMSLHVAQNDFFFFPSLHSYKVARRHELFRPRSCCGWAGRLVPLFWKTFLGFYSHGGFPIAGWFLLGKMPWKWMMTGGIPIPGNLHLRIIADLCYLLSSAKQFSRAPVSCDLVHWCPLVRCTVHRNCVHGATALEVAPC